MSAKPGPARPAPGGRRRVRARVTGIVQGVGFRPYVYRLARELALDGYVLNDERGVVVEAEGEPPSVEAFLARLPAEAPPLASVEGVVCEERPPERQRGFAIVESRRGGEPLALVSPDTATCGACLRELFDPADRRFRYPFVNCTDCGPRFTIVSDVPYDRPLTTMAGFEMCAACRAEYEDPLDRRFHAEPNACPVCGPSVRLDARAADALRDAGSAEGGGDAALSHAGSVQAGADAALLHAGEALLGGAILAIKGIGGYHLACRADDEAAVAQLRARKHREDRPFALMAADLEAARVLVDLSEAEERLLVGRERPIVLAPRRPAAPVAPSVAPRSPDLGVMLPYSPLHHVLLSDVGVPLVMTSGNTSDEPIAYRDDDARERLVGIADLVLLHDRPIHTRTDDSVVRAVPGRPPLVIRRSRGYVPASIDLPLASPQPLVAYGAQLKSTFCVAKEQRAWVSHHIGDLENWETLRSFREGIEHFERLFAVTPEVVAHDLHPDYLSTTEALEREGVEQVGVQHHHAHFAACLAEHGERGPAVGAIYDGTGYGTDGAVWGGELLVADLEAFERAGWLWPVRMPGGERAVREPWRMACAWLQEALGEEEPGLPAPLVSEVDPAMWRVIAQVAASELAPVTTSMGRFFDAVAALCGLPARVSYEGQAAVELEAACNASESGSYSLPVVADRGGAPADPDVRAADATPPDPDFRAADATTLDPDALTTHPTPLVLDARATIREVLADLDAGAPVAIVAARFHNGVAQATALACQMVADRHSLDTVVLSGGVFQNRRLLTACARNLDAAGLRVLIPERLPPNDGGIAYGQAAVAAARLARARR
ncbi:MAG: carbamoyltransferase HypF [Solirubrobacteraceae bacterium]